MNLNRLCFLISQNISAPPQHFLLKHHGISSSKTVIYCWILGHIGIYGNEKDDKNAKNH